MNNSYEKILSDYWHKIGDFLDNLPIETDDDDLNFLYDFFDLFPEYIYRRINGLCSLSSMLNFNLENEITSEINKVNEILKKYE